jgi:hypothetical protein
LAEVYLNHLDYLHGYSLRYPGSEEDLRHETAIIEEVYSSSLAMIAATVSIHSDSGRILICF